MKIPLTATGHQSQSAGPVTGASPLRQRWGYPVAGGVLGWVLDAYDFFLLVFLLDPLAHKFGVGKPAIVATITLTLAMRPIGAALLGWLSDRFGRRLPLLVCVLYFSVVTALTPAAPTYGWFLVLRALYGIGMGGYWGVAAAVVMESAPVRWRGFFSGLLQAGYSAGYLLAAVAVRAAEPRWGWPSMFYLGLIAAAFIAVLVALSPTSVSGPAAGEPARASIWSEVRKYLPSFLLLTLVMTVVTCLSHGTQDLYPDFLKTEHGFSARAAANIAIWYNVGAILGSVTMGRLSDRLGRRRCISLALLLCLLALPAWAFGKGPLQLYIGAFLMQAGVQGAFGIIPAHLNELSPASARGLFPGLVYQLGVLFGAPCVLLEYALRDHLGYRWALTSFELVVIAALLILMALSREQHGRELGPV